MRQGQGGRRPRSQATRRRIRRERHLRTWTDAEGAWNLSARGLPEDGAEFEAALRPIWDAMFTRARSQEVREPSEAYGFDALIELARLARANRTAASSVDDEPPDSDGSPGNDIHEHLDTGETAGAEGGAEPDASDKQPPAEERREPRRRPHPLWPGQSLPCDPAPASSLTLPSSAAARAQPPPSSPPPPRNPPPTASAPPVPHVRPPTISPRAPVKIIVRVDYSALQRGHPVEGETCDIAGVGPISVGAVREHMARDPFLAAVITKGTKVAGVAHLGRAVNAKQRTALEWLMVECSVLGCPAMAHENDHRDPFARCRETELTNIDPLCGRDHDRKTKHGWALVPGTGKRAFVPPDDPRHPNHAATREAC